MIKELPSIGILQNDKRYRIFEMQVLQQSIVNVKNQNKILINRVLLLTGNYKNQFNNLHQFNNECKDFLL